MAQQLLHHVEIGAKNGLKVVKSLTDGFKFKTLAVRGTEHVKQWLLKGGSTRFLVTELINGINILPDLHLRDEYATNWNCYNDFGSSRRTEIVIDSVFNIAIEVKDVEACVNRVRQHGGDVIREPRTINDEFGSVKLATVRSCVGNVVHTLVNSADYKGVFLPGFEVTEHYESSTENDFFTFVDHVTIACRTGTSLNLIEWYEKALGMKRFSINSNEDNEEGLVVKFKDNGLRLYAMNYWKCSETGLSLPSENQTSGLKFTIGEALSEKVPSQMKDFIDQHHGMGVQHVALYTNSILDTVEQLTLRGVQFLKPPPAYYTETGKFNEIDFAGVDLSRLKELGVLLDNETDSNSSNDPSKYLMQIFTKPLFDKDTFFLELIQRQGATGFGSGNIKALWSAVDEFLKMKNVSSNS